MAYQLTAGTCRPTPRPLNGWWIARAADLGGISLPREVLPGISLLLFENTLCLGDDVGTMDIDYHAEPATIDVLIVRGPNRWRYVEGILRRAGTRLTLCFDLSGGSRPSAFASRAGSRQLLVTYDRTPLVNLGALTQARGFRAQA